jgi:hypothetical protein
MSSRYRSFTVLLFLPGLLISPLSRADFVLQARKTSTTFYGPEKRAIARANAEKYEWARAEIAKSVEDASPWVNMTDDELWRLVISPEIKRALAVNEDRGCPNCGRGIYAERGPYLYAFEAAVEGHPWEVRCPNCKELFPKNDFEALYESGISDEDGLFHHELADRSLLYNAEHPDSGDPLHTWCVDDGNGWQRPGTTGLKERDWFIGYHVCFSRWNQPMNAIRNLAKAYSLTGEPIYAHKCLIVLDRLADVYPDLNGANEQFYNNVWGRYSDGIFGPSYWAGGGWASLAVAYDMIYDTVEDLEGALEFIRAKSHQYRVPHSKDSVEDIKHSVEQRIFIDRFSKRPSYQMNGTISEMCEAKVDLVLRGQEAIDEFAEVHMPRIVPPKFLNNDGSGNERSIGYDRGAFSHYANLLVELYDMDRELAKRVLDGYPRFRAAFDFWPDVWCVEKYLPNIGDSAGGPGYRTGIPCPPRPYLALYDLTGNPRYAQAALMGVEGDLSKLPRDVFSPNPEAVFKHAHEAYEQSGTWHTPSLVKPDYKLAVLRAGEGESRLALWLFFSPAPGTSSHSHYDALNFGLFAHGLSMVCEQGYPLFTGGWPSRWEWTSHTRSHATVTVDGASQKHCTGGRLLGFAGRNGVQMISAEAPCVYDNVSVYKRTLILAEAEPGRCFVVDVFRVRGGSQHVYAVPMYYGEHVYEGPELVPHPDLYEGYVEQVRAGMASEAWWVDTFILDTWGGKPAAHLRVHGGAMDALLMLGMGETRLGDERPERLPYIFLKRESEGDDVESTFVLLYEPYHETPFLPHTPLKYEASLDRVEIQIQLSPSGKYLFTVDDGDPSGTTVSVGLSHDATTHRYELSGTGGPDAVTMWPNQRKTGWAKKSWKNVEKGATIQKVKHLDKATGF